MGAIRKAASEASEASEGLANKRSEFAQAQKSYQSKVRFGKTSTRSNGLSAEEIGPAPQDPEDPLNQRRTRPGMMGFGGAAQLG